MAVIKKHMKSKEENPEVLNVKQLSLSFSLITLYFTEIKICSCSWGPCFLCLQLHPKASSPDHQRADVKIQEDILCIPRNKT